MPNNPNIPMGHDVKANDLSYLPYVWVDFVLQPKHALMQTWCIKNAGTLALIHARTPTEDMCVKNTALMVVSAHQVSNFSNDQ